MCNVIVFQLLGQGLTLKGIRQHLPPPPLSPTSILFLLFEVCMGMTLTVEDFSAVARRPRPVMAGVAAQYTVMVRRRKIFALQGGACPHLRLCLLIF